DRIRRREASRALPDRTAPAAPRHDGLSLFAESPGPCDIAAKPHEPAGRRPVMSDTPQLLLSHHLKALKRPTSLREYDKLARQCASEGVAHSRCLLRLRELELSARERRIVGRRIKAAR